MSSFHSACMCELCECARTNVSAAKPSVSLFILMLNIFFAACTEVYLIVIVLEFPFIEYLPEKVLVKKRKKNLNALCQIGIAHRPTPLPPLFISYDLEMMRVKWINAGKITCMHMYCSEIGCISVNIFKTLFSKENVFCFRRSSSDLQP